MAPRKHSEKSLVTPYDLAVAEFGGWWKPRVISYLAYYGKMRYSQLRERLDGISDTTLTKALKDLRRDGMVIRINLSDTSSHVEYTLTKKGLSAYALLVNICAWGYQYHPEMATEAPERCRNCDRRHKALQALITEVDDTDEAFCHGCGPVQVD